MIIEVCKYCGGTYVERHSKYQDRCSTCGKRLGRYRDYKSKYKNNCNSAKALAGLNRAVQEYAELALKGYIIPEELRRYV